MIEEPLVRLHVLKRTASEDPVSGHWRYCTESDCGEGKNQNMG